MCMPSRQSEQEDNDWMLGDCICVYKENNKMFQCGVLTFSE